jgi:hypothetical protein
LRLFPEQIWPTSGEPTRLKDFYSPKRSPKMSKTVISALLSSKVINITGAGTFYSNKNLENTGIPGIMFPFLLHVACYPFSS